MKGDSKGEKIVTILGVLVLALFLLRFGTEMRTGIHMPRETGAMQTARVIRLAMFQYARDHGGKYPHGESSTEIFQKLVDGRYLSSPDVCFLDMPGKVHADANATRLSPKNVGYDVTVPMTEKTPEFVPSVFATGYRIEYKPGGSAIPLADHSRPDACQDGLPVAYANNNAYYKHARDPNGVVMNVIPANANLGPGPYIQLTPEGPLAGN